MMATYLLLGEPESEIQVIKKLIWTRNKIYIIFILLIYFFDLNRNFKDWRSIQALVGKLGKNSLKQRIGRFSPDSISAEIAQKAKIYIEPFNLEEIREVSAGAATFFVWVRNMLIIFINNHKIIYFDNLKLNSI